MDVKLENVNCILKEFINKLTCNSILPIMLPMNPHSAQLKYVIHVWTILWQDIIITTITYLESPNDITPTSSHQKSTKISQKIYETISTTDIKPQNLVNSKYKTMTKVTTFHTITSIDPQLHATSSPSYLEDIVIKS